MKIDLVMDIHEHKEDGTMVIHKTGDKGVEVSDDAGKYYEFAVAEARKNTRQWAADHLPGSPEAIAAKPVVTPVTPAPFVPKADSNIPSITFANKP